MNQIPDTSKMASKSAPAAGSQVDCLIEQLEDMGLGWSLDHTARLIEARVWDWPMVIGRYRPSRVEPLAQMLSRAMADAGISNDQDQVRVPDIEVIKTKSSGTKKMDNDDASPTR